MGLADAHVRQSLPELGPGRRKAQSLKIVSDAPTTIVAPDKNAEYLQQLRDGLIFGPQPGQQEMFLSTSADIAFYGGAAGGGKSRGMLLEGLRHLHNSKFFGVIFRRTSPEITNEGGLWDDSKDLYDRAGAIPKPGLLEHQMPGGGTLRFAHMEHEKTKYRWKGSQVPFFGFDEVCDFTESMFWYMLSRNRSTSGIRPYIRGTCNPDANSWVAEFIKWWIDQDTGYPIPERGGVIRWFLRLKGEIFWADTREELVQQYPSDDGKPVLPKSFTFIPSTIEDNQILMLADPDYRGNLEALPPVERERLLKGNWKIRASAGTVLDRGWFKPLTVLPNDITHAVRGWDNGATGDGGDWTVGVKMGKRRDGSFIIMDVVRGQWATDERKKMQKNTATLDGPTVQQVIEQEPGSSGKDVVRDTTTALAGSSIEVLRHSGDKVTRAIPFAGQAQGEKVYILKAPWTETYLAELHAFPTKNVPDDQVDATTNAFRSLTGNTAWKISPFRIV